MASDGQWRPAIGCDELYACTARYRILRAAHVTCPRRIGQQHAHRLRHLRRLYGMSGATPAPLRMLVGCMPKICRSSCTSRAASRRPPSYVCTWVCRRPQNRGYRPPTGTRRCVYWPLAPTWSPSFPDLRPYLQPEVMSPHPPKSVRTTGLLNLN